MNDNFYKEFEKFSRNLSRGFRPNLDEKLNPSAIHLLARISHKEDLPIFAYGKMLRLEKSSMSYLVDLLEAKDLVLKKEDPHDRRRKSLVLTDKGKTVAKDLKEQHKEFLNEKLSVFDENQLAKLAEAYETVLKLGKILEESTPKPEFSEGFEGPRGPYHPHFDGKRPKPDCE